MDLPALTGPPEDIAAEVAATKAAPNNGWGLYCGHHARHHLDGATLAEAIENNFPAIAQQAGVGNAAGYRLVSVRAEMDTGWPGVLITIVAFGQQLAHMDAPPATPQTHYARIFAKPEDLPAPVEFTINRNRPATQETS